jgi:hypothetical protein
MPAVSFETAVPDSTVNAVLAVQVQISFTSIYRAEGVILTLRLMTT